MQIMARAKINWTLDVVGKRADGYHELDMLLQSVAACDVVTLQPANQLTLSLSQGARVPETGENLVLKAALALQGATGCTEGAAIHLRKYIPIGAGMGGGSADAAAVLFGLNRLWKLNLSLHELEAIGLKVGADVPFCISGGLKRARGMGEQMEALPCARQFWLLVVQPCRGLGTKKVFSELQIDEIPSGCRPDNEAACLALAQGDLKGLCLAMGNALQPTSERLRPEIQKAVKELQRAGAKRAMMTGSGSAVYGVFASALHARNSQRLLNKIWPVCFMTHTCLEGLEIAEE